MKMIKFNTGVQVKLENPDFERYMEQYDIKQRVVGNQGYMQFQLRELIRLLDRCDLYPFEPDILIEGKNLNDVDGYKHQQLSSEDVYSLHIDEPILFDLTDEGFDLLLDKMENQASLIPNSIRILGMRNVHLSINEFVQIFGMDMDCCNRLFTGVLIDEKQLKSTSINKENNTSKVLLKK